MNPDQAQWQQDGDMLTVQPTIQCSKDGSFKIESGSFSYTGTDPDEASDALRALMLHGQEQAQGGGTGS